MTPFDATISASTTVASLIVTVPLSTYTQTFSPSTVVTGKRLDRSDDKTLPLTTWYRRISVSAPVGSATRALMVLAGRAAKAASVGAKTVKGPGLLKVSTRPAAETAAIRLPKFPFASAMSTIVF